VEEDAAILNRDHVDIQSLYIIELQVHCTVMKMSVSLLSLSVHLKIFLQFPPCGMHALHRYESHVCKQSYHCRPLEKLSKEHSEDLVLFGDVTTKELVVLLGVGSKGLLALESGRGGV
jgi:hypothetical protein